MIFLKYNFILWQKEMRFLYPRSLLFWQKCQLATLYHLRLHYYVGQNMGSAVLLKQSSSVMYDKSSSNLCAVNSLHKSLGALCSSIPSVSHWATNPTYVNTHPINSNLWGFPLLARRSQFLLCYKKISKHWKASTCTGEHNSWADRQHLGGEFSYHDFITK